MNNNVIETRVFKYAMREVDVSYGLHWLNRVFIVLF